MADNTQTNPSATEAEVQTEAGAEGSSQGGFSEAFAERSAPEPKPEEKTPETPAAEQAPAKEETAAAPAADSEAPAKAAADASSGTKAPAFDPYAGMTPELKAHWEKVAASERSNRGRVGALTKKLNGIGSGTQAPPATDTGASRERSDEGGEAPAGKTGESKASDIEARLKAVTDEYGDIVGPVAELLTDLRKEVSELKASATRHEVSEDAAAQTEALAELERSHPDFRDYNETNEKFVEWFKEQPAGVQALVNSFDPREVSLGLQLYKAESNAASGAVKEEGEGNNSSATGEKRERQLDALRDAPNSGAPASSGVPNEFGAAFQARAKSRAA
jgi:hypothetical protein